MYTVRSIAFNLDHEMNPLHFISNEDLIPSFACPSAKFSPLVFLWDSLFFFFFFDVLLLAFGLYIAFFFFFYQYSSKITHQRYLQYLPSIVGLVKVGLLPH
jgi:hypothetical protein